MNIDTIRIFCDLVEMQNFSRTADKHGVSQSAVSQQIAQLELTHKCQLINRKKRPPSLTPAGEIFFLAGKEILERYDRLVSDLTNQNKSPARINLAAIFSIGMHTLQPFVKKFMAKYPNVYLHVEYCSAATIYDRLQKGDIDFGLVAVPRKMRNIDVFPFEDEPMVLVCGPSHPLAALAQIDIHELQGIEFIAFDKGVPTRSLTDSILAQYGVTVRMALEFDNIETIKRAVEISSTAVSILPEPTIQTERAANTLRALSFMNDRFIRPTAILVRKDKRQSQASRYLLELLQKQKSLEER
jgi:LysR family transcriptional regulator, transcriptional activator of the cysJI operon